MKSRIKILLSKEWLCDADAVDLLEGLIESKVSYKDFVDLVRDRRVDFYLNNSDVVDNYECGVDIALGLPVLTSNGEPATILAGQMIRVLSSQLREDRSYIAELHGWGSHLVFDCDRYNGKFEAFSDDAVLVQWSDVPCCADGLQNGRSLAAFFKTVDIQALADVMNGAASSVSYCDVAALKDRVAKLEGENAKLRAASNTPDGLVFPYSTPELEVMRDMAVKYWTSYNAETDRKPLQKQIGIEISEVMNWTLSGGSAPSRQATSLATAIQPKQHRGN